MSGLPPWHGQWGNSKTCPPDGSAANALSVVNLVMNPDDEEGGEAGEFKDDQYSEIMCVTLLPSPGGTDDLPGPGFWRPAAKIQWGVGGAQHEAEVDVIQGQTLNFACSFIRVSVFNEATGAVALPVDVAGMVGRGMIARTVPAQRTRYSDAVPVADSRILSVPNFGLNVLIQRSSNAGITIVESLDRTGGVVERNTIAPGSTMVDPLRMAGDAVAVRVTNSVGMPLTSYRTVFGLAV